MGRKIRGAQSAWEVLRTLKTQGRAGAPSPPSVEERLRAGALKGRKALIGTVLDLVIEAIEARDSAAQPSHRSSSDRQAEAEKIVERLSIEGGPYGPEGGTKARTGEELRALGQEVGDLARAIGEVARSYAPDAHRLRDVRARVAEARRQVDRMAAERRDVDR